MADLYDILEPYLDPEGEEAEALERCGQPVAEWLDELTRRRITEDSPERVLPAAAGCLAELSVFVVRHGGDLDELSPGKLSAMRDLAEMRLGRFGLMDG